MLHNLQGFEAQVCFLMARCADRCWSLWCPRFISITCSRSSRHLSLLHIEPAGGHNNMFHYKIPAHTLDLSFYNHTQYVIVHLPRAEQTPSVQLSTYLPDPYDIMGSLKGDLYQVVCTQETLRTQAKVSFDK